MADGDECIICLEEMNEETRCTLPCGHSDFHLACVQKHFVQECPLCRHPHEIEVYGEKPEAYIPTTIGGEEGGRVILVSIGGTYIGGASRTPESINIGDAGISGSISIGGASTPLSIGDVTPLPYIHRDQPVFGVLPGEVVNTSLLPYIHSYHSDFGYDPLSGTTNFSRISHHLILEAGSQPSIPEIDSQSDDEPTVTPRKEWVEEDLAFRNQIVADRARGLGVPERDIAEAEMIGAMYFGYGRLGEVD